MNAWAHGYVENFDYTFGFYRELAPSFLKFGALVSGHRPAFELEGITYCELGCGQGFSTNLLAAANPGITFFANDFIPSHIVNAQRLARAGQQENVRFYDQSFHEFISEPTLPASFDIIALHGVYSWVSPDIRRQVLSFIRKKLSPGGMVYISYNALPGWAPIMPLRRLFVDRAANNPSPQSSGIGDALSFARTFESLDAGYFRGNGAASSILKKVSDMPEQYFAHEFLNEDWSPFYFQDLVTELSEAKLTYAGSLNLVDRQDDLSLSSEQSVFLQQEIDGIKREARRDFLVNQQFRTDLFVRGSSAYTFKGRAGAWLETRFALLKSAEEVSSVIKGRIRNIELNPDVFNQIVGALAKRAMTIRELLGELTAPTNWDHFTQIITLLVGSDALSPCLATEGEDVRVQSCAAFNRAVSAMADDSDDLHFLASPVTGSGIALDRLEQIFLKAVLDGHEDAKSMSEFAWKGLGPQGFRLSRAGHVLHSKDDNLAELATRAETFKQRKLGVLRLHRIL